MTDADHEFFHEHRSKGCEAYAMAGSVALLGDVEEAIKLVTKPIRGMVQMSLVLRDHHSQHLPASVIDLGLVEGIGYISRESHLKTTMRDV
ncbi:hypothetical protein BJ878DRAFT_514523 [Calycina marina]|uniref:Uncharacterized protein n=1 Tax=Calycina marina TaxID=1763456 RepID=A0A9P8CDI6_9HELO|nr:hypothetical protein BJ878DRAFT_514523 [Calycina marina]